MRSSVKLVFAFLAASLLTLSCSSLSKYQAPQDGPYTMRNCQPLPVEFLRSTFAPPESLPSQFQPYIDFWSKTDVAKLDSKRFDQARAILFRLAADEGVDDSQRKVADTLALKLEHSTAMLDVAAATAEPPEDTDDLEDSLNEARALLLLRKRFPALAESSMLQAEQAAGDCMLQTFVTLFDDSTPIRLPLVSWQLQSASSYKTAHEEIAKSIPKNVACLSTSVDIFKDQAETFINFRALPKGTAIQINGVPQQLPANASTGTFRLELPPYDKTDGRAVVTLLVPLPLPAEPLFAPWLSQRNQE